ncbi:hypothetical protein [Reichenbachiella ulvae]|uniref:DUF4465 domain-containing protein n=1 Tax=Reichenbachiella ulvae TaxID=2980104 RepID=A0ABT3CXF6_9BACT|nr:hypothetical protein [Reichenbachiella ulvae]MCV9388261.1 hypothetical protein [Reichenbachiella ulvae]
MKKLTRMFLIAMTVFAVSCDSNDDLIDDILGDEDIELMVTDKTSKSVTVFVSDLEAGATSFNALVDFTSTDASMRRLYITENYFGAGDEPYDLTASAGFTGLDTKLDGSIDLERDYKEGFSFDIPFKVYDTETTGKVVYTLWATSGRGDFRDTDKRLAVGLGTITVDYGGNNPATDVKEYTTKLFYAPLGDGSSETFISMLDGQLYQISEGEEYAAFWDFGYYYGGQSMASFASTADYPQLFDHDNDANTPLVDVATLVGIPDSELNEVFFSLSDMDFAAVTKSSDLDGIVASTEQRINGLVADNVVEFVDSYGKKGLIQVVKVQGTFNQGDYIEVNIKVQP